MHSVDWEQVLIVIHDLACSAMLLILVWLVWTKRRP